MKLPNYLEFIKEGLIKIQPYDVGSNPNSKIDDRCVIWKIDTNGLDINLYHDPNYLSGHYLLSNIPLSNIEIVEKEC